MLYKSTKQTHFKKANTGWRCYLDDGRDELFEEVNLEKVRPVVMDEVDDEAFDVRSVLILISHDHDAAIA